MAYNNCRLGVVMMEKEMGIKPMYGSDSDTGSSPLDMKRLLQSMKEREKEHERFVRKHILLDNDAESSDGENCFEDTPVKAAPARKGTASKKAVKKKNTSKGTASKKAAKKKNTALAKQAKTRSNPKKAKRMTKRDSIKSLEESGKKVLYGSKKNMNWQGFPMRQCKFQPVEQNFMYLPKSYKDNAYFSGRPPKYCYFCKLEPCIVEANIESLTKACRKAMEEENWRTSKVRDYMSGKLMKIHCGVFGRTHHKWMDTLPCVNRYLNKYYPDECEIPGPDTEESSDEEVVSLGGMASAVTRPTKQPNVFFDDDSDSDEDSILKPIPMFAKLGKKKFGC